MEQQLGRGLGNGATEAPRPVSDADVRVVVVGGGTVGERLVPMLSVLGWTASLARTADDVTEALPMAEAVVVLSHHEDVDGPAIAAALAGGAAYVGAMGSRRTQARRREWLLGQGLTEAELDRVRAPIGLDIGADTPGEIAVSIVAELVAARRGRAGTVGSISDRDGAIHPELPPGEAVCPGG